jgi:hypothetical protein
MRFRFASLALLSLAVALGARQAPAADPETKPALVVRVASFDTLISDIKYIMEVAGKGEEAKQFEGILKAALGPDGIEGFDTTKPIGAYGKLTKDITSSPPVLLIPVTKPDDLLAYMKKKGITPDDPKDGLYKAEIEGLAGAVYFRFANGYAYVTMLTPEVLEKGKLLKPEAVFAQTPKGNLSVTIHIDEIPATIKKEFLNQVELQLAEEKKKEMPNESKLETAFRLAIFDEMFDLLKAVTNDGGPVSLVFDIDRMNDQMSLSARFAATPNTPLAARVARWSQSKSLAPTLLSPTSALYLGGSVGLPDRLRKTMIPLMDEAFKKALEEEKDKDKRELLSQIFKALTPTLQAGEFDGAFDLRGPSSKNIYTLVGAVRVQDGLNIEKTVKQIFDKAPPAEKAMLKLNVDKVNSINIHSIDPLADKADEDFKQYFGTGPVYFAFREDAAFVVMGDNALATLKNVLTVTPKPGPMLRMDMSMGRFAQALVKENKAAPQIAKEVFKTRGSDRISITLEGGKELNLKMSMKMQVIAFFMKLDEAKNKGL